MRAKKVVLRWNNGTIPLRLEIKSRASKVDKLKSSFVLLPRKAAVINCVF
jgi:hypothetical protein